MGWPENDVSINELKRRWDEGHFREDYHAVHGVRETLDEAAECLSMYDDREGGTAVMDRPDTLNDHVSRELVRRMADRMDSAFGYKTCRMCSLPRRNDPCDDCYGMARAAAEWVEDPGKIPTEDDLHPCLICDDGLVYTQICGPCMDAVLGG